MEKRFKNFICKNNLLADCRKLLLAVSGGPDSLAMLELFHKFREDFKLELAVAHLDHMFRAESRAEADFVEENCQKKKIKLFRRQVNLPEIIKRNNLSDEAKNILNESMMEVEKEMVGHYEELLQESRQTYKEEGIKVIQLSEEEAEQYEEMAYEAVLNEVKDTAPNYAGRIEQKLFEEYEE